MRILIAGYRYEDSFADNVAFTLDKMGHSVRTLGVVEHAKYYAPWRYYLRMALERLNRKDYDPDGKKLKSVAKEFKPDVVLMLTREFSNEVLSEIKKKYNSVLISWWTDPVSNVKRWGFADPINDLVFLKDDFAIKKTKLLRSDVYKLHEAMNPTWHKPMSGMKSNEIVVAGNYYAFRQQIVKRLIDQGEEMGLYGPKPPVWSIPEVINLHKSQYVVKEEKSRVFGQGLACLNSFQFSEGNSLNCRAFEIAGSGGLQLIEDRPCIRECFESGKELLTFSSFEELCEHIQVVKKDSAFAERVRKAGADRALSEHTYRHRT